MAKIADALAYRLTMFMKPAIVEMCTKAYKTGYNRGVDDTVKYGTHYADKLKKMIDEAVDEFQLED